MRLRNERDDLHENRRAEKEDELFSTCKGENNFLPFFSSHLLYYAVGSMNKISKGLKLLKKWTHVTKQFDMKASSIRTYNTLSNPIFSRSIRWRNKFKIYIDLKASSIIDYNLFHTKGTIIFSNFPPNFNINDFFWKCLGGSGWTERNRETREHDDRGIPSIGKWNRRTRLYNSAIYEKAIVPLLWQNRWINGFNSLKPLAGQDNLLLRTIAVVDHLNVPFRLPPNLPSASLCSYVNGVQTAASSSTPCNKIKLRKREEKALKGILFGINSNIPFYLRWWNLGVGWWLQQSWWRGWS